MDQPQRTGINRRGQADRGRRDVDIDIFLATEHDPDPQPEPGDFWVENPATEDDGWDAAA